MKLLFMGPPGAGKGSQAAKVVEHFKIPSISTGEMFRNSYQRGEELGIEAMRFIENGNLVSDEITNKIVKERLSREDIECCFLLDGYPRTVQQAEALDIMLKDMGTKLSAVVNIVASNDVLFERMENRRVCKKCGTTYHLIYKPSSKLNVCDKCDGELYQRLDDTHDSVKRRLEIYESKTKPLLDYYQKKGILHNVNGMQSFDEVFKDVLKVIGE